MPVTEIKRPNFYEGQYLGAADLVAAQEYQRQQDQRHRLAGHTWGIAVGLELDERLQPGSSDAVDVYIKPGYAVDGFGRAIVVLEPYKITEALFAQFTFNNAQPEGQWISVWLRYNENKTNPPAPGFAVCDVKDQAYRVLETFEVVVGDLPSVSQQRDQISVAGKSLDAADEIPDGSVPYQEFPDDEQHARWLIRLGSVRWVAPNPPTTTTGHFVKSATEQELKKAREGRLYIGVVAESVLAPAGKLRIRDRKNPGPAINETADLVGIEGSLRVDGTSHFRDLLMTDSYVNIDSQDLNNGNPTPLNGLGGPALTFGLLTFEEGIASKRTPNGNQYGLDFYTKNETRLSITNDGNVGIGTDAPLNILHVNGNIGIRQNKLYLSGGDGWSSLSYNAHHDAANTAWVFPDPVRTAVTVEMDDSQGTPRFEVFNTTPGATNQWTQRLAINGSSGNVAMAHNGGNVGIGTPTPVSKLQIGGDLAFEAISQGSARTLPANGTLVWNDGTWLRLNQNLDFSKPILGVHTPGLFAPGSLNVGGGANWGDPGPGNAWITGNVGIGTTTPAAKLDVAGDVRITGNLTIGGQINGSDQRLKSNIVPLTNVLEKIQQIHGVSFDWNATYASLGYSTEGRQIGVLAQEVQRVFPELVTKWGNHNYLGLDYSRLTAVLVEAVKELAAHNEALSQRVQALEMAKTTTRKSGSKTKEGQSQS
jgi:hypothetical protein